MKNFISIAILVLCMTAYTQQGGAKAAITQLADMCMNGNNVPAQAQSIVHTVINTAFAAMGRRRLAQKRRLGTMAAACTSVYNAATSAAGMPPVAAKCFASSFNAKCVPEVAKYCTIAAVCT